MTLHDLITLMNLLIGTSWTNEIQYIKYTSEYILKLQIHQHMDIAFRGLIGHSVVVYLDDVTVFSKKREDHLFHLKQNFDHCRKYDISLNPKKGSFVVLEGKLLGHIISKKGISIDPERIESISQIPLPHNKKGMQSFMGTINFVRRIVPNFAQIVKPLQQIVK